MTIGIAFSEATEQEEFERALLETEKILFPGHQIDDVFRSYTVPESQVLEVIRYLANNSDLDQFLVDAIPHIERVFGEAKRYLEIDQDPEGESEELFCVILVDAEPEQALGMLKQLDETWFTEASYAISNRLNFTVDTLDDEPI